MHVAMAQLGQNGQRLLLLGGRKGARVCPVHPKVAELEMLEDLSNSVISLVLVMVQILLNTLAFGTFLNMFQCLSIFLTLQAFGFGTQAT